MLDVFENGKRSFLRFLIKVAGGLTFEESEALFNELLNNWL